MVKTRSGKNYYSSPPPMKIDRWQTIAKHRLRRSFKWEKLYEDEKKESSKLAAEKLILEEKFMIAKESYVSVLGVLVNRSANYRLLTLLIEKLYVDSKFDAAQPYEESECSVCYEIGKINILCKNKHVMCLSCVTSWNWSRRYDDFMENATCPCCRENFIPLERDVIFDMAGISFNETQVRIQ
ncbi:MAG: hypothetical protein CXT73_06530 [Methanobacteriota archaeon]|nr:MAG: hypothetical protein CXT73_06530 [Euryarchaeota archaeon]